MLLGLLLGLLSWLLLSRVSTARVTVLFPGVQTELYLALSKALRAVPGEEAEVPSAGSSSPTASEVAAVILSSDGALEAVVKAHPEAGRGAWRTNKGERLREQLRIEATAPGVLRIELDANDGNLARVRLQELLNYYSQFVQAHKLSRTTQALEVTEVRIRKVQNQLRSLEEKMVASPDDELRALGEGALRASPKVMTEIWLRRMEEEQRAVTLLNKMQKIRGASSPTEAAGEDWLKNWGRGIKPRTTLNATLRKAPRRQVLLDQVKLERDYDENLMKYRSLVLQRSFLQTVEALRSDRFEMIDPVSVRSTRRSAWVWLLYGAMGGAFLWGLRRAGSSVFARERRAL